MSKRFWLFLLLIPITLLISCNTVITVEALILNHDTLTLEIEMSEQLILTCEPVEADMPAIEWFSTDCDVVEVDDTGLVAAISPGTAHVTARTADGKLSVECIVTVTQKSVKGITLNRDSLELEVGSSEKLQAIINPVDAGNKNVLWSSTDEAVAKVELDGVVTALSPGAANITVTTEDGEFSAECIVTVKQKPTSSPAAYTPTAQPAAPPQTTPPTTAPVWAVAVSGANSANNVSNYQLFTRVDNWLYYNDISRKGIYKIKVDGTSKTLLKRGNISEMAVHGQRIYFIYNSSSKHGVYQIDLHGNNEQIVTNYIFPTENCRSLNFYNNSLYFIFDTGSIQKISLQNKTGEIVPMQPTTPRYMGIWGKYMYYTNRNENDSIYRMNLDTNIKTRVNSNNAAYLNVYEGYIYYANMSDGGKIYRDKVDGSASNKVCDEVPSGMNVHGGWIYYTNSKDGNKLYKITINGTNKTKVSDDTAFNLNIVGDWIFYHTYGATKVYIIKNDGSIKYEL